MSVDVEAILKKVKLQLADNSLIPNQLQDSTSSNSGLENPLREPVALDSTVGLDSVSELTKRIVTFCLTRQLLNGKYPDEEALLIKFPTLDARTLRRELKEANDVLVNRRFMEPLILEQVDPELEGFEEVDPEFYAAIELVADALDKRSLAAKMKQFGKTTRWWNNMLQRPLHKRLFELKVNESYASIPELSKIALVRNVEAGDLQAVKYAEEKLGIFRPNQQAMIDFGKVISQFMEILVQYLPAEKLSEVADRMEAIINLPDTSIKEIAN